MFRSPLEIETPYTTASQCPPAHPSRAPEQSADPSNRARSYQVDGAVRVAGQAADAELVVDRADQQRQVDDGGEVPSLASAGVASGSGGDPRLLPPVFPAFPELRFVPISESTRKNVSRIFLIHLEVERILLGCGQCGILIWIGDVVGAYLDFVTGICQGFC